MFSLALIIFVVSEKKPFEHFLIGSNANLFPAVAAILDFDWHKQHKFCRGPSNDHYWAVWFQLSEWFQRRSVLKHFPIGSNVKLSPAVAAILNFISEQKA